MHLDSQISCNRKTPHPSSWTTLSILDDEDFTQDIQEHLQEIAKEGYIWAQDIVDHVSTPAIQERLGAKK